MNKNFFEIYLHLFYEYYVERMNRIYNYLNLEHFIKHRRLFFSIFFYSFFFFFFVFYSNKYFIYHFDHVLIKCYNENFINNSVITINCALSTKIGLYKFAVILILEYC